MEYGTIKGVYVMKCPNPQLLVKSRESGVWGVNTKVAETLRDALQEKGKKLALVFSVNMSGHFQGYALVSSQVVDQRLDLWGTAGQDFDASLEVQWVYEQDLPFGETKHLKNALNSNKGVQVTKHGQEIELEAGKKLCELIRSKAVEKGVAKCGPPAKPIKLDAKPGSGKRKSDGSGVQPPGDPSKLQKTVDQGVLNLLDMSYDEYLALFDKFGTISLKINQLSEGLPLEEILNRMSGKEKADIVRHFSRDDFVDVCRIVCSMNDVYFSTKVMVDFYNSI